MRARLAALLLAVLMVSGCLPPGAELDDPSAVPLPELAEPAQPLPDEQPTKTAAESPTSSPTTTDPAPPMADAPSAAASSPDVADQAPPATEQPVSQAPPPPPAEPPPAEQAGEADSPPSPPGRGDVSADAPVVLADIADRRRDAGLEAPPYADVTRLLVEADGQILRVTVEVAGDLPSPLGSGEVVGLGVDIHASEGRESDYQLFADGGSDGWRAYLQTPEGFVAYPGTFGLGGQRVVFEVPWTAVGDPPTPEVSLFLDWSRERLPLNAESADRAPDSGRLTLRR